MNAQLMAKHVESLFTLPEIALRINEALNVEEPSNQELEELIISDPAFTAKLLNIVNSAYFGFPGTIDTVSRALTIIGHRELRNLVISTSVTTSFKGIPAELVDMDVFWFHSVTCAVFAKMLAKNLRYPAYERLFIGGLLHSVGRLIYFTQCPVLAREILMVKDQGEEALIDAEVAKLGFTYAELGAEFLKLWKLPVNIWQMIRHHLDPLNAGEKNIKDACVIHVAGKVAATIEPCVKYDFDFHELEPDFKPWVIDYLKITPNQVQYCIEQSLEQSMAILSIIYPKGVATL